MKKTILLYSLFIVGLAIVLTLTKALNPPLTSSIEWTIPLIAVLFYSLGHVFTLNEAKKKLPQGVGKTPNTIPGLTNREYEVLCEIANGLSNREIATKLFLSESTIKTHVSSLLVKLNAKRRTQAVTISRALNILS